MFVKDNQGRKEKKEKVYRYSLRKYSFGVVSVAISALVFLGAGGAAHAIGSGITPNNSVSNSIAERLAGESSEKKEILELVKKLYESVKENVDTTNKPEEKVAAYKKAQEEADKIRQDIERNILDESDVKQEAIEKAKATLKDTIAKLDNAKRALNSGNTGALKPSENLDMEKGKLKLALDKLDANIQGKVDRQDRTKESLENYNKAIRKAAEVKDNAENVLTGPDLTKEKIADELKKVEEADNALTKAKNELEYDKTEIRELSKKLNEAITKTPDLAGMTKDSIENYNKAISEAKKTQEKLKGVLDDSKADISKIAEIKTETEQMIAGIEVAVKNLQVDKELLKAEIAKLKDLNKAQRTGFNEKIDSIDGEAANKSKLVDIVNEAKEIDKLMKKVKDLLADDNEVEESVNFKEADKDKQDAYKETIEKAIELIAEENKPGSDKKAVENLINKIEETKKSLNGEALLKADKQDAEKKIKNDLMNLNKGQKESAKESVEKAKTREEVKNKKEEAVKLNEKMGELKKLIEEAGSVVKTPKYTNADGDKKKEFDEAMKSAKEVADKDSNNKAIKEQVDLMIKALNNARDNLNGKDNPNMNQSELKTAKENAKRDIKNAVESKKGEVEKSKSLTQKEKDKAIKEIDEAGIFAMENIEKAKDKSSVEKAKKDGLNAIAKVKVGKDMDNKKTQPMPQPKPENSGKASEKDKSAKKEAPKKKGKSPKTGDEGAGTAGLLTLLGAAGIAGTIRRKDEK